MYISLSSFGTNDKLFACNELTADRSWHTYQLRLCRIISNFTASFIRHMQKLASNLGPELCPLQVFKVFDYGEFTILGLLQNRNPKICQSHN